MSKLSEALRPVDINDVLGQEHLLGEGKVFRRMVECKRFKSTILWGPPGVGKTSLVRAIAKSADIEFIPLNATSMTTAQLRSAVAKDGIIFLDEIHRAQKNVQDILLPALEETDTILFGATTETPRFSVNKTILSRCLVYELKPIDDNSMLALILRARDHIKSNGGSLRLSREIVQLLILRANGDARKLLSVLEVAADCYGYLDESNIDEILPGKNLVFDSKGSSHFDFAHCYQDAIQDSDENGAIYWLAAWLESGEDPAYICRRMLIAAYEDCAGNPFAILSAVGAALTAERTGMPECMIPMAHATIEMAKSKRNKAAFYAIHSAMADVRNGKTVHIPNKMRAGNKDYSRIIEKEYVKGFKKDFGLIDNES